MLYLSHLLEDEQMKQLCDTYHAGLESIEFSIGENLQNIEHTLLDYEKRIEKINPPSITVHGPFVDMSPISYDSDIATITYKRFSAAHFAAKKLGAQKMIIHTCLVPQIYYIDTWIERTVSFWTAFLEKHHGVTICLENVLDWFPEPMEEIAKKMDCDELRLCLDFGHANAFSKTPVEAWATKMAPHLSHLHVHDNLGDADSHLAIGEGNIDFAALFPLISRQLTDHPSVPFPIDMTLELSTQKRIADSVCWLQNHGVI